MKTNQRIFGFLVVSLVILGGCKQENVSSNAAPSSTAENSSDKSHNNGCTVASVDGGAQITCGSTSAFIANGSSVNSSSIKPVLIHEEGGATGLRVEGDYVISMTRGSQGTELITIWVASVDAIAQYENGVIFPILNEMYFESKDCSGEGRIKNWFGGEMKMERLVFVDRYYKVLDSIATVDLKSKRLKDGACLEVDEVAPTTPAIAVKPGITTVLRNPRIKVR